MAGSISDLLEADLLKAITGQATTILTTTPLTNIYMALMSGTYTPGTDTVGTEATGGSYARVQTVGKWGTPSGTSPTTVANNAIITFGPFTGSVSGGVALTHFALYTASSGGVLLGAGDLNVTYSGNGNTDSISFAIGTLTITAE